jgi:malonyl-CoA/methylmalonyl-CoA synthetase
LLERSARIADALSRTSRSGDRPRIVYLLDAGFDHVAVQWGIWRAGAIGVPVSAMQAPAEWSCVIADCDAELAVADETAAAALREAAGSVRVVTSEALTRSGPSRHPSENRGAGADDAALILYTSGTTGKPKGAVLTHANIEAQVRCLVAAWEWREDDRILHVLPLNHVHGIVNVLTCALWAGAMCEMPTRFDAAAAWSAIAAGRLTLFMAVPTVYSKLIAAWEAAPADQQRAMSNGCRAMRLMVSGSAALPVRVLERWRQISGHTLLERYGMTEIGMALSNPLKGERRPGFVGVPLPGVHVRIVDEQGKPVEAGRPGEVEVRGPGVFREYWRRPDATMAAFRDGWFRTGDVAVVEDGMYRLLGRQSVDIIKCGGYKVSALEIEEVLREHPGVVECAVVGTEDAEWGERIAVAIVPRAPDSIDIDALRDWARPRLARYKLPTRLAVVSELPRNVMGKVSKGAIKQLFKQ